jgi:hypothetical protein
MFDSIPIELKVRRGKALPLDETLIHEKFPPGSQAAAYASNTRLAFVLVLDLPENQPVSTNLSKSIAVINKDFGSTLGFPTSVITMIFHCHHPKPSSIS